MAFEFPPPFVLMLGGTSLTAGRLCNPPYGWPMRLLADMRASPECKGEVRIINTGQGSQTSNFGATQAAKFAALRPSHVLMEDFGINDCAIGPVSIPTATANFNSMVASYLAANPDVVIVHQTMSPASLADTNRVNLATYYNNGLANAVLNGLLSIDNYYGSALVPGGWPKPLNPDLTVPADLAPAGFSVVGFSQYWDPAAHSGDITLSNANLTVTRATTAANWRSALGLIPKSTGKWFYQGVINVGANVIFGIATSALNLATYPGEAVNGYGYSSGAGNIIHSAGNIGNAGSFGVGDTVSVAYDLTNLKLWVKKSGGDWNGSPTANPATNVGGLSIVAGTYLPAVGNFDIGSVSTATFYDGDGLHPLWTNAFQLYSYPNILAWARDAMADYWPS